MHVATHANATASPSHCRPITAEPAAESATTCTSHLARFFSRINIAAKIYFHHRIHLRIGVGRQVARDGYMSDGFVRGVVGSSRSASDRISPRRPQYLW